jgi:hypothetical protein
VLNEVSQIAVEIDLQDPLAGRLGRCQGSHTVQGPRLHAAHCFDCPGDTLVLAAGPWPDTGSSGEAPSLRLAIRPGSQFNRGLAASTGPTNGADRLIRLQVPDLLYFCLAWRRPLFRKGRGHLRALVDSNFKLQRLPKFKWP